MNYEKVHFPCLPACPNDVHILTSMFSLSLLQFTTTSPAAPVFHLGGQTLLRPPAEATKIIIILVPRPWRPKVQEAAAPTQMMKTAITTRTMTITITITTKARDQVNLSLQKRPPNHQKRTRPKIGLHGSPQPNLSIVIKTLQ